MQGGNKEAWPHIKAIFQGITVKVGTGGPCCDWVGDEWAGHIVKMVHNRIEYGDMQLICEAYHLMKNVLGVEHEEMAKAFEEWNRIGLESFLIEITANILKFQDTDGKYLLPKIRDSVGAEGHREVDRHLGPGVWCPCHPHQRSGLCSMLIISEGREDPSQQKAEGTSKDPV